MAAPKSFEEIMAPMASREFLEDYWCKRPLHLEGSSEKFSGLMNWEILNRLLGVTTIWSQASLKLILDKEPVPVAAYCAPAPGRDGVQVLRPEPSKVKAFLKEGATLVANDLDQLTRELSQFSRGMEEVLGGKVQGNLYLSSKRKQGFRVHYDTHDVFAVHCAGEKTWMVFEGRASDPIAHTMFKTLPQDHHEREKGNLWREVRLKPGDILYLPRGQYHYALADDGACMHIAFGVTYPIGLDVMSYLFERIVAEPVARANLPQGDAQSLAKQIIAVGKRVAEIAAQPQTLQDVERFVQGYRYSRELYDLPDLVDQATERFRVKAADMRLVEQGGRVGLVKASTRQAVEVPLAVKDLVAWVIERETFEKQELAEAFAAEPPVKLDKFLQDMQRMQVVERAS